MLCPLLTSYNKLKIIGYKSWQNILKYIKKQHTEILHNSLSWMVNYGRRECYIWVEFLYQESIISFGHVFSRGCRIFLMRHVTSHIPGWSFGVNWEDFKKIKSSWSQLLNLRIWAQDLKWSTKSWRSFIWNLELIFFQLNYKLGHWLWSILNF